MLFYVVIGVKKNQYSAAGEVKDFAVAFNTKRAAENYRKQHPLYRFDRPVIETKREWLIDQIPAVVCEYLDTEALPTYADGYHTPNDIAEEIIANVEAWRTRETENFVDGLSENLMSQEPLSETKQLVYSWIGVAPLHTAMIVAYFDQAFEMLKK